jgi:predicted TPR repeat methyltransferase
LTWYERTLVLDPSRAIAWANKGELFEKTERKADAAKAYKKFLEISPMHPSAAHVRSRLAALED